MTRFNRLHVSILSAGSVLFLSAGALISVGCSQEAPAFSSTSLPVIESGKSSGQEGDAVVSVSRSRCEMEGVVREECVQTNPASTPDGDGSNPSPLPTQAPGTVPTVVPKPTAAPTQGPKIGDWREVSITEPAKGKVDILWLIDSSGSMKWAQEALSSKFENFAQELQKAAIDFQIGITSLDVCRKDGVADAFCPENKGVVSSTLRGTLVPFQGTSSKFLTSSTTQFVEKFRQTALLGTSGSGFEQGLSAARFAVMKSAAGGENAGFIRSDARLSMIVLSDEEDDGIGFWEEDAWGKSGNKDYFGNISYPLVSTWKTRFDYTDQHMTADRFVGEMNTLKGTGKFQLNAIAGIKNADGNSYCYKDVSGVPFGPMEAGTNYQKTAQLTGGSVENICGQWDSILKNLGRSTVELTTRITLPSQPYAGTLEVYVNGVIWVDGYGFDAASNSVVFKSNPPYGAHVVVRYREIVR